MKASALTSLLALASTSLAATVVLKETPCLNESELEEYTVETDKLVVIDMQTVCGLRIASVSPSSIDLNAITCQAFRDAEGTQPGSAKFTYANPALISTNPVQEAAVKCDVDPNYKPSGTANMANGTASASAGMPSHTGGSNATVTMGGPSETGEGAPEPTGAAGVVGWSVGAVAVGMLAMLV